MSPCRTRTPSSPERGRPAGVGRRSALALCIALGAALAAAPPPLAAQEGAPCKECAKPEHDTHATARERKRLEERRRAVERDLERDAARIRRELTRFQRDSLDRRTVRALRAADSALAAFDASDARTMSALALAEARLSRSAALEPEMARALARAAEEVARMHVRLAELQVESARGETVGEWRKPQQPEGWMGIGYSGDVKRVVRDGAVLLVHHGYPMVETVEPGSPADQAGLEAGDTIIAYNGRDVRAKEVSLTTLLTPGRRVVVKVRRAGSTRAIPVTIARRPRPSESRWTFVEPLPPIPPVAPAPPVPPARAARVRAPRPSPTPTPPAAREPSLLPGAPRAPDAPTAPVPDFVLRWERNAVAGAEVVRMNDDLRDAFGGRSGVLVLGVGEGSPADDAGLRGGDVIVRAGGDTVTTPDGLRRALRVAAKKNRALTLHVVRKGTERQVKLAW